MKKTLSVGVIVLVLSGGLLMSSRYVSQAVPPSENPEQPFDQIQEVLRGVTQSWDKNLPSASRFTVLAAFNNEAVRDNNTGLVWEQSPITSTQSWLAAHGFCREKAALGNRGYPKKLKRKQWCKVYSC